MAVLLSPQMGMAGVQLLHDGWQGLASCEELRPAMTWDASAGRDQKRAFIILTQAKEWCTIAITEVDLNQPFYWQSLGDFRSQIERHRPEVAAKP